MKDLPFTWKDYLLEQLDEEHVRKKICELEAAFQKEDEDPEYSLSYLVFCGAGGALVLPAEESTADPMYSYNNLSQFTQVKNEVDRDYAIILKETILEMNGG